MNENLITLLRHGRHIMYRVLEPLDLATRLLNNKRNFPPLHLRSHVGDLNDFEGSGGEYAAYLKLLCGLKPGGSLLDIGCGCGLMVLPVTENLTLPEYIYPGRYIGVDIDKKSIDWCRRNIRYQNCIFLHVDGTGILLFGNETFDVILVKSVFTHLLIDETITYLKEIKRLLKPGGKCLSTWFLVSEEQDRISTEKKRLGWKPRYDFSFQSCNGHTWYLRPKRPRLAVAYEEDLLLNLIKLEGFNFEVRYGTWSGRQDGLSFQDIIIIRRQ